VARRSLFSNTIPTVPGGGTVHYVQPHDGHVYLEDIEHREEGGTPAIVESIRAGLVLEVHRSVDTTLIEATERQFLVKALDSWARDDNIVVLGPSNVALDQRISIVSFLIRSQSHPKLYLHHNFVVALLNDVFGVQSRGGCSCAGPYGHYLLGIDRERSDAIATDTRCHGDTVKPGWARLAFSYYFSPATVDYIIRAVHWVAKHGDTLLAHYLFDPQTTLWVNNKNYNIEKHRDPKTFLRESFLALATNRRGRNTDKKKQRKERYPDSKYLQKLISEADALLAKPRTQTENSAPLQLAASTKRLVWFVFPPHQQQDQVQQLDTQHTVEETMDSGDRENTVKEVVTATIKKAAKWRPFWHDLFKQSKHLHHKKHQFSEKGLTDSSGLTAEPASSTSLLFAD